MNQIGYSIGVLAETDTQLADLQATVEGAGFEVEHPLLMKDVLDKDIPDVDVWVANLEVENADMLKAVERIDSQGRPIIFDEELPPDLPDGNWSDDALESLRKKQRRLAQKLRRFLTQSADDESDKLPRAREVWVLAASTGGPDAVAQFFSEIPDDLNGVAFLYAQHIYQNALGSLSRVVSNNCNWFIRTTNEHCVIRERTVYLVSPGFQIELDGDSVAPVDEPWGGRFHPSIDQVVAKVARVYKDRGGVMVFSGMGSDGTNSCTLLHHRGGKVWTQSTDSCTIDSMPACVEETGCVQFSAPPRELAKNFVNMQRHGTVPPKPNAATN